MASGLDAFARHIDPRHQGVSAAAMESGFHVAMCVAGLVSLSAMILLLFMPIKHEGEPRKAS